MFKKGDVVVCTEDSCNAELIRGKSYIVNTCEQGYSNSGCILTLEGLIGKFYSSRFHLFEDQSKNLSTHEKENAMNEETITLSGKKYRVEVIEGKGECLVPVGEPRLRDLVGKVVLCKRHNKLLFLAASREEIVFCTLRGLVQVRINAGEKLPREYKIVADSLSDAAKKGLL